MKTKSGKRAATFFPTNKQKEGKTKMKVQDLLLKLNADQLVSIERPQSNEPIVLDEASKMLMKSIAQSEVVKFYPEFYKGLFQTGITIKVKGV